MSSRRHPTAIIHPNATLASDVVVGPYVVIGPHVEIATACTLAAHVVIERDTTLGPRCTVGVGSVLGSEPQDHKYHGQASGLVIGADTCIREYVTINRGTVEGGLTAVGERCFLMSYVHVAHNCVIEDDVVLANAVQLAGHVCVERHAAVGGLTPIHQFVRIGTHAFVGGGSRLPRDVPPYTKAAGNPIKLYGINSTGLVRAGFSSETRLALKRAYRLCFNSKLTVAQAAERIRLEAVPIPEVERFVDFVARSERGVLV